MIEKLNKLLFSKRDEQFIILSKLVNDYRKENQSLSGRIKILEEQHDIMHNFLVEINKYLVNLSEKDKK